MRCFREKLYESAYQNEILSQIGSTGGIGEESRLEEIADIGEERADQGLGQRAQSTVDGVAHLEK